MEEIKLDVQVRNEIGTSQSRRLRREDFIPAIVYGSGKKPTAIKLERKGYEHIMRLHHGENVVFHMTVLEGGKKLRDYSTIVKKEQHDAVTEQILHVDFQQISLTEKIEVEVSVVAKGTPVGVTKDGGTLEHSLWELEVSCLPTNIPPHIEVDVSRLEINDAIQVKDIVLPQGVTTKVDPEKTVLKVVPPMQEEPAEPVEGEEAAVEPEVIKEKPKEGAPEKKGEGEKKPQAEKKAPGEKKTEEGKEKKKE